MKRICIDCGIEFNNKKARRCSSCRKKYHVIRSDKKDEDYLKATQHSCWEGNCDYTGIDDLCVTVDGIRLDI